MKFSDPLRLDDLGDRTFRLVIPFSCELDDGRVIVAPEGFITDFASVPQIAWNIIPPIGPYGKPAVIHDVLYRTLGFHGLYTRKEADLIFLDGMEICGVPWLTRHTMYRAVRLWSWNYWRKPRSKRLLEAQRRSTRPTATPALLSSSRTERIIATLDPKCQNAFTKFAKDGAAVARGFGCDYIAISGNRTWEEQDALYAQGRTKPGRIVTNARGGYSNHNFGIAADFGVFQGSRYMDDKNPRLANKVHKAVAKDAFEYGLDWGGNWANFKDYPHFERHTGMTITEKRAKYLEKGSVL